MLKPQLLLVTHFTRHLENQNITLNIAEVLLLRTNHSQEIQKIWHQMETGLELLNSS